MTDPTPLEVDTTGVSYRQTGRSTSNGATPTWPTDRNASIVIDPNTGEVESIDGKPVEEQTPVLRAFAAAALAPLEVDAAIARSGNMIVSASNGAPLEISADIQPYDELDSAFIDAESRN